MNVHPGLGDMECEDKKNDRSRRFGGVIAILHNDLLDELLKRRPISGRVPAAGDGGSHKWKVTLTASREPHRWKVFTGSGCVNDEIAAIQYRRENDPRGWKMPVGYPPFAELAKVFGENYPFVDRPLYETRDRPHVLLTTPDAALQDLGGFERVADRSRPPLFRTKAMWQRELFRAHVVVAASPFIADPWQTSLHIGGAVQKRWRVHAGRLPIRVAGSGVSALDFKELARIWLVRVPGKPEADRLFVQQQTFWSLQSRSAINQSLLELAAAAAEAAELGTLALLPLGLAGITVGTSLLGIEAALANLFLAELEGIASGASTVEFWSV